MFQLDKRNKNEIFSYLKTQKYSIQIVLIQDKSFNSGNINKVLDKNVKIIIIIIFSGFKLSMQKAIMSRIKKLWRNKKSRIFFQKMRESQIYQGFDEALRIENLIESTILKNIKSNL